MKAVIGIGTNIGDRALNIRNAVEALDLLPDVKVLRCASIYETDPWGFTEQQSFLVSDRVCGIVSKNFSSAKVVPF